MSGSKVVSGTLQLIVAAVLGVGTGGVDLADAALDPLLKCEAKKLQATGKKGGAGLKCHSKAAKKNTAVDPTCLSKAETKFQSSFTKADAKGVCAAPGDALTIGVKVDTYVNDTATALAPGGNGACASKKLGAASKKVSSLFKALSKDTKKPDAGKFQAGFFKAQDKFKSAFDKAEEQLACSTIADAAPARLDMDAHVEDVIGYTGPTCPQQLLYATEGNRMRRFDIDTIGSGALVEDIFIERASVDPVNGRDVNGEICFAPDGSGDLMCGEDTGQTAIPAGWGKFDSTGTQIGKNAATYHVPQGEPHGCEFASNGTLFTSSVGEQQSGGGNGQLILWFPPFDEFPGTPGTYPNADISANFCKLVVDIATAGSVAIDDQDRVYVASARGLSGPAILRYSPPFPTGPDAAGGCGQVDALGAPLADSVNEEVFIVDTANVFTPTGIVGAPNGNWYVSSVFTGVIAEYDQDGNFVRRILEPADADGMLPLDTGHPQGMAIDCQGDVYYADIALIDNGGGFGPGPNGAVRRIAFDLAGVPYEPDLVRDGLSFPDGVAVTEGNF
jgi:hypothetical protein